MANIQPFDYQKSTNIEEHNQIVNKVNEIVQVINDVNLDTINSEIANLKTKATETDTEIANIKDKDTTQDTEINGINKNLVSNVTATFDNPSRELKISLGREASPSIDATVVIPSSSETGQYSAGNGINIENYQIAVDTNVVALKTDIPVVPDVSEITNRLDTIDGEITGINTDITNLTNKNTEQDTAINGKVAIAQGTENAGKVLGIGEDGNVTPVNAGGSSGGGEVWEEVNLNNWPTDWIANEKIKIQFSINITPADTKNWSSSFTSAPSIYGGNFRQSPIESTVGDSASRITQIPISVTVINGASVSIVYLEYVKDVNSLNQSNYNFCNLVVMSFNGASCTIINYPVTYDNISSYVYKLWRSHST